MLKNYIDRGQLQAVRVGERRIRIRRSALEALIAAVEPGDEVESPPGDEPEAAGSPEIRDLPAQGRERLASALAQSSTALASSEREQVRRALISLAEAARALAAALENPHAGGSR